MENSAISMLWHAFEALKDVPSEDFICKSKLKVMTFKLCIEDAQKCVMSDFEISFNEDVKSVGFLDYVNFLREKYFLKRDTFKIPTAAGLKTCKNRSTATLTNHFLCSTFYVDLDALDTIWHLVDLSCWEIFRIKFGNKMSASLTENTLYSLWLIFNTFCEQHESSSIKLENKPIRIIIPPMIDGEEATYWFKRIGAVLNRTIEDLPITKLDFFQFIDFFANCMSKEFKLDLQCAAESLANGVVNGTLACGYLQPIIVNNKDKRLNKASKWKPRWCVLIFDCFVMLNEDGTPDLKSKVQIKDVLNVQSVTIQANQNNCFQITSFDNEFQYEAADIPSKMFWLTAFRHAIDSVQLVNCNLEIRNFEERLIQRRDMRQQAAERQKQELLQKEQEKMERDMTEAELKDRISRLRNEYNDKVNELDETRRAWTSSTKAELKKYKKLEQIFSHCQENTIKMKQEFEVKEKELKCRIAQLEEELLAANEEILKLKLEAAARAESNSNHISQLQTQLQQQKGCIANEATKNKQLEALLESEKCGHSTTLSQLHETKSEVASLQNQLQEMTAKLTTANQSIDLAQSKVDHLTEKIQNLENTFLEEQRSHELTKLQVSKRNAEFELSSKMLSDTTQNLEETRSLLNAEIEKRASTEDQMSKLREKDEEKQEKIKLLTAKDLENQKVIRELHTNKTFQQGTHRGPGFLPNKTKE